MRCSVLGVVSIGTFTTLAVGCVGASAGPAPDALLVVEQGEPLAVVQGYVRCLTPRFVDARGVVTPATRADVTVTTGDEGVLVDASDSCPVVGVFGRAPGRTFVTVRSTSSAREASVAAEVLPWRLTCVEPPAPMTVPRGAPRRLDSLCGMRVTDERGEQQYDAPEVVYLASALTVAVDRPDLASVALTDGALGVTGLGAGVARITVGYAPPEALVPVDATVEVTVVDGALVGLEIDGLRRVAPGTEDDGRGLGGPIDHGVCFEVVARATVSDGATQASYELEPRELTYTLSGPLVVGEAAHVLCTTEAIGEATVTGCLGEICDAYVLPVMERREVAGLRLDLRSPTTLPVSSTWCFALDATLRFVDGTELDVGGSPSFGFVFTAGGDPFQRVDYTGADRVDGRYCRETILPLGPGAFQLVGHYAGPEFVASEPFAIAVE